MTIPNKQIIILNGTATCGKDTFVSLLKKYNSLTYKYSIIDPIKEYLTHMGVPDNGKTEKDRKAMSDLKVFLDQWDVPYQKVEMVVDKFYELNYFSKKSNLALLFIDMREPNDIQRAVNDFGAIKVLVKNDRVNQITSNVADAGVYNIEYDYTINNNGTLEELKGEALKFIKWLEGELA